MEHFYEQYYSTHESLFHDSSNQTRLWLLQIVSETESVCKLFDFFILHKKPNSLSPEKMFSIRKLIIVTFSNYLEDENMTNFLVNLLAENLQRIPVTKLFATIDYEII